MSGTPLKVDGTKGAPFTATIPNTVSVANNALVVLTDQAPITLASPDLAPGLDAIVTLSLQNAGEVTLRVPDRRRQRGSVRVAQAHANAQRLRSGEAQAVELVASPLDGDQVSRTGRIWFDLGPGAA